MRQVRVPEWVPTFSGCIGALNGSRELGLASSGMELCRPSDVDYGWSGREGLRPKDPELHRLYFVTARHNIEQSRNEPGTLYVRVNTEDGGSVLSEVSKWDWTFHDDPTIDVAVLAPTFAHQADRTLQHTYIEADSCVTPERIRAYDIGVGTAIAVIGLFNQREGNDRNVPIVRSGIIAAMPGEPIADGTGTGPYQAYLAEVMSIGGLSGSPVLACPQPEHRHKFTSTEPGVLHVGPTTWTYPTYVLGTSALTGTSGRRQAHLTSRVPNG